MNQDKSLTKIVTLGVLLSFGTASLIPTSVRAEELANSFSKQSLSLNERFNAPIGINIQEIKKDNKFSLSHGDEKIFVELLPNKPGRILVNDKEFRFSQNDSPKKIEADLRLWLQNNIATSKTARNSLLDSWIHLLMPKAYAFNWWIAGLVAVAVVGIVVALSNNKKTKDNNAAIEHNNNRMRRNAIHQARATKYIDQFQAATEAANAQSTSSASTEATSTASTDTSSGSTSSSGSVESFTIGAVASH